eukprot:1549486-Rhodomonas_salina.6
MADTSTGEKRTQPKGAVAEDDERSTYEVRREGDRQGQGRQAGRRTGRGGQRRGREKQTRTLCRERAGVGGKEVDKGARIDFCRVDERKKGVRGTRRVGGRNQGGKRSAGWEEGSGGCRLLLRSQPANAPFSIRF